MTSKVRSDPGWYLRIKIELLHCKLTDRGDKLKVYYRLSTKISGPLYCSTTFYRALIIPNYRLGGINGLCYS